MAAIIAVVVALGVRRRLSPDDIYTLRLNRRGQRIPRETRAHMFAIRQLKDLMSPAVGVLERAQLGEHGLVDTLLGETKEYAVVTEGRNVVGVVRVHPEDPARRHGPLIGPVGYAKESSFLQAAMTNMADRDHAALLIIPDGTMPGPEKVIGVLTRDSIAAAVLRDYRS